jgi:hypothetical protein
MMMYDETFKTNVIVFIVNIIIPYILFYYKKVLDNLNV